MSESRTVLRALLRDKIHIRPGTLARLPSAQAETLSSPLALARRLLQPLSACPSTMLRCWAGHPRGHAVIGWQAHIYRPGRQAVGRRELDGVAWISARRLLAEAGLAGPIANIFDHLLGSDGQADGPWLSDGTARNAVWQEVADRLQRQFRLGYGPEEAMADPHAYFAWGLCSYLEDRRKLNATDPGLERLLRSTLFDPAFWRRAGYEYLDSFSCS